MCYFTVVAKECNKDSMIVVVHPGDEAQLLCPVRRGTGWIINNGTILGVIALLNGTEPGHSSNGRSIIVKNIMLNDVRNGSEYRCVKVQNGSIIDESNSICLYVAGEYTVYSYVYVSPYTYACMYIRTYVAINKSASLSVMGMSGLPDSYIHTVSLRATQAQELELYSYM